MKDLIARSAVFNLIKQVPQGKVSTYQAVAKAVGIHPRQVGRILHTNTTPELYPCHRVVHADGKLAAGYAFGGPGKQQALLEAEGVKCSGRRVQLGCHFFNQFSKI